MFGNCDEIDVSLCDQYVCDGPGVCQFSKKRHVELEGRKMTSKAQVYPPTFSHLLADIWCSGCVHGRAVYPSTRKLTSTWGDDSGDEAVSCSGV
eukprot:7020182-Pyramimonas_sp.AAC.1